MPRIPNSNNHLTTSDLQFGAYALSNLDSLPGLVVINADGSSISATNIGGNVNLNAVGGVAVGLGQTSKANSIPVVTANDQSVSIGPIGLTTSNYDSVVYANTSTTVDTYTYLLGGVAGVLKATVTITYTDTTKTQVSTVVRT
jgi:hypothetical protein